MIKITPQSAQGDNPDVLIERILIINKNPGHETYLRIALLTADNKPLPYLLVQIYQNPAKPKYVLNYALYPDRTVYEQVSSETLGCSDFIIAALNKSHAENIKVYTVLNGQEYTNLLFNNQLELNKLICNDIDSAMTTWIKQ